MNLEMYGSLTSSYLKISNFQKQHAQEERPVSGILLYQLLKKNQYFSRILFLIKQILERKINMRHEGIDNFCFQI